MKTLKILKANNKSLVGKLITVNEKTGLAKMGRTDFDIRFGFGTIDTNKSCELFRLKKGNLNSGILIQEFEKIS